MTSITDGGVSPVAPLLVVTAGLPGTGKSTLAEVLSPRLGVPLLSVDPIEHAILAAGIDADQPTGLAAYLVAETMAETVLASGRGIVVDAVNAVTAAREQWLRLAERQGARLRFLEVICSDLDVYRERLSHRPEQPSSTNDGDGTTGSYAVERSIAEWEPWTGATAAVPRATIDTLQPLGVTVEQALGFLASA